MLGAIALIRAAIWVPLLVLSLRTWLHVAIGVAPLPFLRSLDRKKYLCYVTLLAGAGGTLLLGASYLNCSSGNIFCAVHDKGMQLPLAASCYIAMLVLGMWWLNKLSRRAKSSAPAD